MLRNNDLLLIGDIGGTNARFAIADPVGNGFQQELVFSCADFESAEQGIHHYLSVTGLAHPGAICLAGAGPVVEHKIDLTNNHWTLDFASLGKAFPDASIHLLNDFEAIAYAVPLLAPSDCQTIGVPCAFPFDQERYLVGILGAGTGLGVAGLCKSGDHFFPLTGEGGHVGFAPENTLQQDILGLLRDQFGRVSCERLISGSGLANIHAAVLKLGDYPPVEMTAADIFVAAAENDFSPEAQAVSVFFEVLGQIAGDLALTLGASDGIFIGGGIVPRYTDMMAASHFRRGFENKGRHSVLLEKIPTHVIVHPQPGLLGAGYMARELLKARRRRRSFRELHR